MNIVVNGKKQEVEPGTTVTKLLMSLDLDPDRVAIELNLAIVSKDQCANTTLAEGDSLEIVQFVGGG